MHRSQLITQLQLMLFIFFSLSYSQIIFEDSDEPTNPIPKDNCLTPENKTGNCERWTTCQSLRQITDFILLQTYVCGIEGKDILVCCSPESDDQPDSLLTTTPPRRNLSNSLRRKNITGLLAPITKSPSRRQTPIPIRRITTTTTKSPALDYNTWRKNDADSKPSFLPDNCGTTFFTNSRVVGGQVAEKGGWPWMAILLRKNEDQLSLMCGGSLVTDRYVITAAHCVVNGRKEFLRPVGEIIVKLGAHDLRKKNESESIDIPVETVRFHKRFDAHPRTMKNDIAVLRLRETVRLSPYISPVCLPYDSLQNEDLTDKSVTVTGFGSTSEGGSMSPVLMETSLVIWDQEICEGVYEKSYQITDSHLCAASADGSSDSCQGDSGGPLVAIGKEGRFYVVGIVSSGYGCARPGYPGVYTRVTKFLNWLAINLAD